MSHSLKMVELWQPRRPRHDTVEGWMPPVNIYLPCECVSVCGSAWRQELLWGFICGMTRQPVIYEHLELLFKHSLISRQTFPEARAEQEWPRPDQTRPHTVSPYPAQSASRVRGGGRASWERSIKMYVRVFTGSVLWAQPPTAENNSVTLQWRKSSARSFSSALLIGLEVNGVALNTNGRDPSSSTDLNKTVETRTKQPSLMLLFGGNLFYINLKINSGGHYWSLRGQLEWAACYHFSESDWSQRS